MDAIQEGENEDNLLINDSAEELESDEEEEYEDDYSCDFSENAMLENALVLAPKMTNSKNLYSLQIREMIRKRSTKKKFSTKKSKTLMKTKIPDEKIDKNKKIDVKDKDPAPLKNIYIKNDNQHIPTIHEDVGGENVNDNTLKEFDCNINNSFDVINIENILNNNLSKLKIVQYAKTDPDSQAINTTNFTTIQNTNNDNNINNVKNKEKCYIY